MFEGLSELTKVVEKYGIVGGVIVALFFALVTFFKSELFSKFFDSLIKKMFKGKSKTEIILKDSDIINHEIFNYIDFWVYSSVPTLTLKTEYRTVVFRKYLHIYFKAYSDNLHIFVNGASYKEMEASKLKNIIFKLLNDIIKDYESEMRRIGIPDIIINKMKIKNNETINLSMELINGVCESHFYDTENNFLKLYTILNILTSTLEYTMTTSEEVCNTINGALSGQTFSDQGKNVIEP